MRTRAAASVVGDIASIATAWAALGIGLELAPSSLAAELVARLLVTLLFGFAVQGWLRLAGDILDEPNRRAVLRHRLGDRILPDALPRTLPLVFALIAGLLITVVACVMAPVMVLVRLRAPAPALFLGLTIGSLLPIALARAALHARTAVLATVLFRDLDGWKRRRRRGRRGTLRP